MDIAAQENSVSALLVGAYERDRELVREIFRNFGWKLFEAQDRRRAFQYLDGYSVQVVIAEAEVANWSWQNVLHDLRRREPTPQLIVTSRLADDYLWAEALNVGAYDVLSQPFERDEVERVISSAARHFEVQPKAAGRQSSKVRVASVA